MKLSEAIRLGSLLHPQTIGNLIASDGRTCALGAAIQAYGGLRDADWYTLWPVLLHVAKCPHCSLTDRTEFIVIHLNDVVGWTREAIAEWVETQEQKLSIAAEPKPAEELVAHAGCPEGS